MPSLRKVVSFLFSEAAVQAFWTYGFPPLFGVSTTVIGFIEKQPVMWTLVAGAISFAMMSFGLLAFGQWRFRRSPEHKIIFARLMVTRVDGPPSLIALGFVMKSTADFPIEVSVTRLTSSMEARIPKQQALLPRTMTVDASSEFYFSDNGIDISGVTTEDMTGSVEYTVCYGRPKGRKYTVSNALTVFVPLDRTKPFTTATKLASNEQPNASSQSG